ncbi:MAG: MBL fold metallo-hydrolase [Capsulimonadaceae bacterium]|nr:MBL fold metallo-hydrolase [Capsulimonadaceae bacterium]
MSFLTGTLVAWLGQSCFVITTLAGAHLLIDPVNPAVGYPVKAHSVDASVIFVSHNHFDHNWTDMAVNADNVVEPKTDPGYQDVRLSYTAAGKKQTVIAKRIFSYHDQNGGKDRGTNTITVIDVDGLRICHLGDLGQRELTPKQVSLIGNVDVLMIPVGGFYTIDAKQAVAVTEQLHPKVIFPMHFQTSYLNPDLKAKLHPVSEYLDAMRGKATVVSGDADRYPLAHDRLPSKPVIVLLKWTERP